MAKYEVIWVADAENPRGYRERQFHANARGCDCYIEGHFNAKMYDRPGMQDNPSTVLVSDNSSSKTRQMAAEFSLTVAEEWGFRSAGVTVLERGERAYWNTFYASGQSLLLEPLYVSDPDQAELAQDPEVLRRIGHFIAEMVRKHYPDGAKIGLSPGHFFKPDAPGDKGAPVHGREYEDCAEADLSFAYLQLAKEYLETGGRPESEDYYLRGRWEVTGFEDGHTRLSRKEE